MMITRRTYAFILLSLASLGACTTAGAPPAVLAPTATLAPIISMTPRFTATPVASRTPLPTFTFTPSDTPIPPTPSHTPTPTEVPPVIGIVSSRERVNVREGPGTSYNSITALDPGTRVEVLEQSADGAWYNILMPDNSQGWMSAALLFLQPTQTPIPSFTPTIDRTAIALGTAFPTAILGGAPVSPTPPPSALGGTPTAPQTVNQASSEDLGVIDLNSFNMTATALVGSITGPATSTASGSGNVSSSAPGGPTGGPVGGPTATLSAGAGRAGSASAQEGVDILAYCDDISLGLPAPTNLQAGATIDVYWSWFAKTTEQIQEHVANVIYEVAVDGNRLTNWRLYAAPMRQHNDGNYYQYWYVPYGPLTAGEHEITYRVTWQRAISDGYDQFGPGTRNPSQTGSCRFTVR